MATEPKFVTPEINLLPSDDLEGRPGGKLVKWALSWGKKIVIITELIVVLAFLSRFKLDSDVANLSDEIERKQSIIQASADFEKKFRHTTTSIAKIKTLESVTSPVTIADSTKKLVPAGINISQITVSGDQVVFSGTGDDFSLSQLLTAFKNSPNFHDVSLNRVTKTSTGLQIDFYFTAIYQNSS